MGNTQYPDPRPARAMPMAVVSLVARPLKLLPAAPGRASGLWKPTLVTVSGANLATPASGPPSPSGVGPTSVGGDPGREPEMNCAPCTRIGSPRAAFAGSPSSHAPPARTIAPRADTPER